MASVTNPLHFSIKTPGISSLYLSKSKVSSSTDVQLRTGSFASKSTRLEFSPLPEKKESPLRVNSSGGCLRFAGWSQQIRQRSTVDFLVVSAAAADADGREIEISDGLESLLGLSFVVFWFLYSYSCLVAEKEIGYI